MKSVCIRSFTGPYFPAFGLNAGDTEYSVRMREIQARKTPNTDTFHAVIDTNKKINVISILLILLLSL